MTADLSRRSLRRCRQRKASPQKVAPSRHFRTILAYLLDLRRKNIITRSIVGANDPNACIAARDIGVNQRKLERKWIQNKDMAQAFAIVSRLMIFQRARLPKF
ncbi:MAG: hypothetical protein LBT62_05505 [Deltaproteobacteria bacterium]|jgi:hypothetical protein|nr:hypothetical protein [Deltaproteobacteria bacterium]